MASAPPEMAFHGVLRPGAGGWGAQLLRYTVVGTASFVLDLALLAALVEWAGVSVLTASIVAYLVALFVDYALSIVWVFAHRRMDDRKVAEFATFAGIGVVGLGVNTAIMFVGHDLLGVHYALSKLAAGLGVLLFTFVVRRHLLFTERQPPIRGCFT